MKVGSGAKFAVLSFLCVMALALSMAFALSSMLTHAVTEWEWENTAALARREVELTGVDALFAAPLGAPLGEPWGQAFSRLLVGMPEVVRVKVWDRQATVLWSDEPRLIGRRFSDNRELQEALAGRVSVEIKTLTGREHAYERGRFATLAEVYVPIFSRTGGELVGVVEVYKSPERLFATIQRGRIVIWTISLTGALILYLILIPLVRQVYGRQIREEALEAHTAELEPTPGGGATFVVELPAGTPAPSDAAQPVIETVPATPGKSILVVDDEPDVAELLAETLSIDGHRVETATSGAAALERLLDRPFDLVFSDMKMPGMSGAELYDEVARRHPGLERRMVFITGDSFNPTTRQFFEKTGAVCVGKPFDVDEIRRLVVHYTSPPSPGVAEIALRS